MSFRQQNLIKFKQWTASMKNSCEMSETCMKECIHTCKYGCAYRCLIIIIIKSNENGKEKNKKPSLWIFTLNVKYEMCNVQCAHKRLPHLHYNKIKSIKLNEKSIRVSISRMSLQAAHTKFIVHTSYPISLCYTHWASSFCMLFQLLFFTIF